MTKKLPNRVNKTKQVLDYMEANPDAKPADISKTLAKEGIKVSPGYVSTIKYHRDKGKFTKPGAATNGRPVRPPHELVKVAREAISFLADESSPREAVEIFRELVEGCGSWTAAAELIEAVHSL